MQTSQGTEARGHCIPVPGSHMSSYFKIAALPHLPDKSKKNQWRYQFIGQGAGAIARRREFTKELLKEKVGSFWDMHVLHMVNKKCTDAWHAKADVPFMPCLVDPPIFTDVPSFSFLFRESGRFAMMAKTSAEEFSHYITIDLNHQWGVN